MARVLKGFHSFTCTPTRSFASGMSQPQLVLIYRPRRDGRLSRPWCEVARPRFEPATSRIASPALYHTATNAPSSVLFSWTRCRYAAVWLTTDMGARPTASVQFRRLKLSVCGNQDHGHMRSAHCALQPASLLCCRPDGLELSTRQSLRPSSQQQQLQATTQDGLVQQLLSILSAVEMLCNSALY